MGIQRKIYYQHVIWVIYHLYRGEPYQIIQKNYNIIQKPLELYKKNDDQVINTGIDTQFSRSEGKGQNKDAAPYAAINVMDLDTSF